MFKESGIRAVCIQLITLFKKIWGGKTTLVLKIAVHFLNDTLGEGEKLTITPQILYGVNRLVPKDLHLAVS